MTMKGLKFKMKNILPTPCTMMVVGHFPCLERLLVCVYAMTQDIASASDFGKCSELMHSPSQWSGQCQVHVFFRAEESLPPVYTDHWCSFS